MNGCNFYPNPNPWPVSHRPMFRSVRHRSGGKLSVKILSDALLWIYKDFSAPQK